MSFKQRYFTYLLVVPVAIGLPLGILFLSQVQQLSTQRWVALVAIMAALYSIGASIFVRSVSPYVDEVDRTVDQGSPRISDALSQCLRRTTKYANQLWIASGLAFSVIAALFVGHDLTSIRHFLVSSALAAGPACAWSYGSAKHLLMRRAASARHVRYIGRHRLTVTRKIAILFIGFFVISSIATVQLVASRVARTLERVAVESAEETFETIRAAAAAGASLQDLQHAVPRGYAVFQVGRDGKLTSVQQELLEDSELASVRSIRTGDSRAFQSPHVLRFSAMPDGSIIGLRVPWDQFQQIPTQITLFTLLAALVTTALFIAATFWFSRDIRQPLNQLQRVAAELARGNFTVDRHVFADDDLGELADSFGETRDNLRGLMSRIGGSGTVITQGVHVITGGTGALLQRSRTQADLTAESTHSVEGFRSGIDTLVQSAQKVTAAADDTSSRSLELQASAEEIARSMDYLFQSVEKTSSSTTEMNASASEMSRRTGVLANIGEDVLSFVAEMDSTVEELRQNSEATAGISSEVRDAAISGSDAVGQAAQGIDHSHKLAQESARVLDELQSSVSQIDQILRVIEDVTEQTNLLALNASIIAAQAGEHGRSFNIVAGEIRQLAERTRGSTKQISGIIEAIRGSASDAVSSMQALVARATKNVSLARNAADSLQTILTSADRSHDMATRISRALGDQAQASRHLHEVTSRMSDHIAEINRSTREQARGTELLAQEAERVREIALQVRTSTDQQSQASRGINAAMEAMASDAAAISALLREQLSQTERIADASRTMLQIARDNDAVAQEFNRTVETLVRSGDEFEKEVGRFRLH